MEVIVVMLLIPVCRTFIYLADWAFFTKVCDKHKAYLKGKETKANQDEKESSARAAEWITENLTEIKRRVHKSGNTVPVISYLDPKGLGYFSQERLNVLDNILLISDQVQGSLISLLHRTRGYFKNETIKSINPLYWLEVIFFLPKALVSASGIDASSRLADTGLKLIQIGYWVFILIVAISKPELIEVVIEKALSKS